MRANQLRVWFSAVAYALMTEFQRTALAGTDLARAQTNTIRVRLLEVGAIINVSVRRVRIALSSVFPLQTLFAEALELIKSTYQPQGGRSKLGCHQGVRIGAEVKERGRRRSNATSSLK